MTETPIIPTIFAYAIFCFSVVLTGWHLVEEHQGRLWRYFGAIAGVQIADWVGRLFFAVLLGVTLVAAAFGILGIHRSEAVRLSFCRSRVPNWRSGIRLVEFTREQAP